MKTTPQVCKVDLHVHGPASADYEGSRGQHGYAELARSFVEATVQAIALTDHNTIKGYVDYQEHADTARKAYEIMVRRDDNPALIKELRKEVEDYDLLNVLPGVEISVYPGVHAILILNPSMVPLMTEFLRDDIQLGDAVETGDPKRCSKDSLVTLLDMYPDINLT